MTRPASRGGFFVRGRVSRPSSRSRPGPPPTDPRDLKGSLRPRHQPL